MKYTKGMNIKLELKDNQLIENGKLCYLDDTQYDFIVTRFEMGDQFCVSLIGEIIFVKDRVKGYFENGSIRCEHLI